ncbi:MAG: gamma-glutamyltransferase [Armatimonadetes bacterium]|nr:gamma-glutamyltransferase [Armatimonadota bacterium]
MRWLVLLLALLIPAPVWTQQRADDPLLRSPGIFQPVVGRHGMVSAGEILAAQAGLEVLRDGGNAVDAAVTTAFAMAVTLPQAGNVGGGGFMVIRTPEGKVVALDFRETAPAAATRDMFLDNRGKVDRDRATVGARAVAVPGTVAGVLDALDRYGTIKKERAIAPAVRLAEQGFPVSHWLADSLSRTAGTFRRFPESSAIFLPGGKPPEPGDRLIQKDLGWTLRQIAERGRDGFYQGPVAEKLVLSMKRHGGLISAQDLVSYRAVWREPVRGTYRGYEVFSMPPPSSGGVHLIQMLNVLEGYPLAESGHNSALTLHRLAEAMRSAYADRSMWLGDPEFFEVPQAWLTSKEYARELRVSIPPSSARRSVDVRPGSPPVPESPDTTHFSVVDDRGWAVSLTYTLNFSYGSFLVAEGTGVLLNNEMDDFSAAPGQPNAYGLLGGEANSIQPGKRPLSSMTPTIVQKDGRLVAVLGSPGGSRIITIALQTLINLLDFKQNAQTAVSVPRIHHQWYPDVLHYEQGLSPDTLALLRQMGHALEEGPILGQAAAILVRPDGVLEGGADPRREGGAVGY